MLKKLLVVCVLVLVAVQFIRPEKNISAVVSGNDITLKHPVPSEVKSILRRACYDCHSNQTHYPWYAEVQPAAWWLDRHVKNGKRSLNFSEFAAYPAKRAAKKLLAVTDEVEHRDMPLKSYTWMHPEARLTPEEITLLTEWAEKLSEEIHSEE